MRFALQNYGNCTKYKVINVFFALVIAAVPFYGQKAIKGLAESAALLKPTWVGQRPNY